MVSFLKKYEANPDKSVDIVDAVIKNVCTKIDMTAYESNSVKLAEVTRAIEKLNAKGIDAPTELKQLKSNLSLDIHDQEKIIKMLEGLEVRLAEVLDNLRVQLSKSGASGKKRRLKTRYVHETSPKILQKEIRKAIRELGGKGQRKAVIEGISRSLEGRFKKNDLIKKNGVDTWILNVTRERAFMIKEGVLKSGSSRGIWELRGR